MRGRVLVIAGSDSGGGAGIQADIKTITVLGGYAMTAITALTAQNTLGVTGVLEMSPGFVRAQLDAVTTDLGVDAFKLGMLPSAEVIRQVEDVLRTTSAHGRVPAVLDPVMIAKGGAELAGKAARDAIRELLLPLSTIVTPNVPEAEALTGIVIRSLDDVARAGESLLQLGAQAALMKGGHFDQDGPNVTDTLFVQGAAPRSFVHERIRTRHTHGTGCTLASAIATHLALGAALETSVERALVYVERAIRSAPGFGAGHGPLDHGWPLKG